jgi:predicted methyltransferase
VSFDFTFIFIFNSFSLRGVAVVAKDFEAVLRRVYESVLKPGDVAIDAGAHIGSHTFPMALTVGPEGKVYAFEPIRPATGTSPTRSRASSATTASASSCSATPWAPRTSGPNS